MNTVILMWNPSISSYKVEQFEEELAAFGSLDMWYNWSVYDWQNSHEGDRFYLVRVGQGNTGIVMSGYFSSDPYIMDDWSGRNRIVYYQDMEPDVIINSDKVPTLTTAELMANLPGFDWTGGHSGRLLDNELAYKLEDLWETFINEHKEIFQTEHAMTDLF